MDSDLILFGKILGVYDTSNEDIKNDFLYIVTGITFTREGMQFVRGNLRDDPVYLQFTIDLKSGIVTTTSEIDGQKQITNPDWSVFNT